MLSLSFTGITVTRALEDSTGGSAHSLPGAAVLPAFIEIANTGANGIDAVFDLRFTLHRPSAETQPMPTGSSPTLARPGLSLGTIGGWGHGGSGGWESPVGAPHLEYLYPTAWRNVSDSDPSARLVVAPGETRQFALGFGVAGLTGATWSPQALVFPLTVELIVNGALEAASSTHLRVAID